LLFANLHKDHGMKIHTEIGQIFRRIRRERLWTLQRVCDSTYGQVTPTHLSKIENGTVPSVYLASQIARSLGLSLDEIMEEVYGEAELKPEPTKAQMVPVLSWVQAGSWMSSPTSIALDESTKWIVAPRDAIPPGCYALKIRGESMQSGGPVSFPDGSYVIIDPNIPPEHGKYVIAMKRDSEESTFKQLINDGGAAYLKPLNPQYPMIQVDEDTIFCGSVIDQIVTFD